MVAMRAIVLTRLWFVMATLSPARTRPAAIVPARPRKPEFARLTHWIGIRNGRERSSVGGCTVSSHSISVGPTYQAFTRLGVDNLEELVKIYKADPSLLRRFGNRVTSARSSPDADMTRVINLLGAAPNPIGRERFFSEPMRSCSDNERCRLGKIVRTIFGITNRW